MAPQMDNNATSPPPPPSPPIIVSPADDAVEPAEVLCKEGGDAAQHISESGLALRYEEYEEARTTKLRPETDESTKRRRGDSLSNLQVQRKRSRIQLLSSADQLAEDTIHPALPFPELRCLLIAILMVKNRIKAATPKTINIQELKNQHLLQRPCCRREEEMIESLNIKHSVIIYLLTLSMMALTACSSPGSSGQLFDVRKHGAMLVKIIDSKEEDSVDMSASDVEEDDEVMSKKDLRHALLRQDWFRLMRYVDSTDNDTADPWIVIKKLSSFLLPTPRSGSHKYAYRCVAMETWGQVEGLWHLSELSIPERLDDADFEQVKKTYERITRGKTLGAVELHPSHVECLQKYFWCMDL